MYESREVLIRMIPDSVMNSINRLKDAQTWKSGLANLMSDMLNSLNTTLNEVIAPYIQELGGTNIQLTAEKDFTKLKVYSVELDFCFNFKTASKELNMGYQVQKGEYIPVAYYNNSEKIWQVMVNLDHGMGGLYDFKLFGKEYVRSVINEEIKKAVEKELESL